MWFHTLGNVDQESTLKLSSSIICSSICHELDVISTKEEKEKGAESDVKPRTRGRLVHWSLTLT